MENRLFLVGLLMGGWELLLRRRKTELSAGRARLMRGAFWGLAAFSAVLVLATAWELGTGFVRLGSLILPVGEAKLGVPAALLAGAIGWALARKAAATAEGRKRLVAEDREWADTVWSSALTASLLMMFVIQAFNIPSGSMEKTLLIGDHLFVSKFLYGLKVPFTDARPVRFKPVSRGDIVVFRFPADEPGSRHCGTEEYGRDLVKRVIGLPGDVVSVRRGHPWINGKPLDPEPYAQWLDGWRQGASQARKRLGASVYQALWQEHRLDQEAPDLSRDEFGPVTVPPAGYFMMGDNRDRSCDSRYWGPIRFSDIKGKAWIMYWPPSRIGLVK